MDVKRIIQSLEETYPSRLVTIDSHTQGEPTRLLVGGLTRLPGDTMTAKQKNFQSRYDYLRMLLTREPRGHRGIMAAVVTEPVTSKGVFGLFYMDARRYPYLCGHATIGAVATLVEAGLLAVPEGDSVITVDTPSGPMDAHICVENGRVILIRARIPESIALSTMVFMPPFRVRSALKFVRAAE